MTTTAPPEVICNRFPLFVSFAGVNGRVHYSISAGDDNEDFEILNNGTIRTRRLLDRETKASYNLIVTARDNAREPEKQLSSTVQVRFIKIFLRIFRTQTNERNFID